MFARSVLAFAIMGTCFGSAALAEQHEVTIFEAGFFPSIVYLSPGDTVVFRNEASSSLETIASDESWTTGSLPANASYSLSVGALTQLDFRDRHDAEKTGNFSFDPAPLN